MTSLTCDKARLALSDLLAGAETDAAALEAHLAQCVACREQARQSCRLHRALSELAAEENLGATMVAIRAGLAKEAAARPRRYTARLQWGLAAAAVLLAVGATVLFLRPNAPPDFARLESVDGEVYIVTGTDRAPATAGSILKAGQGLETVGEESGATVVARDGRRLVLGPDSTLGELSEGQRIDLVSGSLSADGSKLPPDQQMVVVTPQAQVVAQGGRLSMVHSPQATRVESETGSVKLTRRSDGQSVNLAPGTFSIAGTQPAPMAPQSLAVQFTKPRVSLPADRQRIWALAFAPDGRWLVTGGSTGQVRAWDPAQGDGQTPLTLADDLREDVRAVAFSRDGRLLAAGGDSRPLTRLWDWDQRKEVALLPGHRTWLEALAFSADGRTLVVAGAHGQESRQIHLWDVERRQRRAVLDGHVGGVWAVTFSPDGQTLATSGRDGVIKLWDFAREQVRQTLLGHTSEVYALAFSLDGTKLVSSSRDKTVKIWDLATGHELHTLLGHRAEIRAGAFAPDGRTVASASQDGTARLWRVADGRELATFKLTGGANAIAYSPDGRTLAVGGWTKTVQLWDLPGDESR